MHRKLFFFLDFLHQEILYHGRFILIGPNAPYLNFYFHAYIGLELEPHKGLEMGNNTLENTLCDEIDRFRNFLCVSI